MRQRETLMFDRITWNAKQMNGQPCIRGTRLTVHRVVAAIAAYPVREDLYRNYPDLEEDDIRQALEFAAANLAGTKAARPLVRDRTGFERIASYIELNPVTAGLVGGSELFPWSSAGPIHNRPGPRGHPFPTCPP